MNERIKELRKSLGLTGAEFGDRIGITTILTDQLGKKEFLPAYFKRKKERKIQKKLRDHNLFTKGRYYE